MADFKSVPSEVAELASMSMELISMDTWDEFYDSEEELKAKKEQVKGIGRFTMDCCYRQISTMDLYNTAYSR